MVFHLCGRSGVNRVGPHGCDLKPGSVGTRGMAQFGGPSPVGDNGWVGADLPEFTARSGTEDQKPCDCGIRGCPTSEGEDMKSGSLARNSIIAVFILVAMSLAALAQRAPQKNAVSFPHYAVTDLGTLAQEQCNRVRHEQCRLGGRVVEPTTGGPQHAFVWYGYGPLKDLGTLDGAACPSCNSAADGPNLLGQTAIGSETSALDPDGEDFCAYGTHRQCRGVARASVSLLGRGIRREVAMPMPSASVISVSSLGSARTASAIPSAQQQRHFRSSVLKQSCGSRG